MGIERQRKWKSQNSFAKNKPGRLTLLYFKTYYKALVIECERIDTKVNVKNTKSKNRSTHIRLINLQQNYEGS